MADFEILLSGDGVRAFDTPPFLETPICVRADGQCFPDGEWTDFPFDVLSQWAEEFRRNRWGASPDYTFRFMDGPFRIAARQSGDDLRLTGIDARGMNDLAAFEIRLPVAAFLGELRRAFQKLQRIVYTTDAFRDEQKRQTVLDDIGHYAELMEGILAREHYE